MRAKFDDYIRAGLVAAALAVVGYLAVFQQSEAAAGAIIGLLGLGGSYLFRGRVETPKP